MVKNKYTDLDDAPTDKWKNKYLASLEDLEKKEQQWTDSEKNLRALITHLTNAADTSSEKLNQQLSVLRDAINKGIAANKLKKAIDEVSDSVIGLDAIRNKKKGGSKKQFSDLIGKIKPAGKIEKKLTKLSVKLNKTSTAKELSPLIDDLAKLLVYGLSLTEKNKGKDEGFLSSFIKKKGTEEAEEIIIIEKDEQKKLSNLDGATKSLISLLEKMVLLQFD